MRLEVEVDAPDDELSHITTGIVDGMEMMGFKATVRRVDIPAEYLCLAHQTFVRVDGAYDPEPFVLTCDLPPGHGGTIHHDPKQGVEWHQTEHTQWGER